MNRIEKKINVLSERIIESIVKISLGKKPGLFSNSVFKSMQDHRNYIAMLNLYKVYIDEFKGKLETAEELERLSNFKRVIIFAYNGENLF